MKRSVLSLLLFAAVLLTGCSTQRTYEALPESGEEETYYMNGVWVATAANIDFPSQSGLSATAIESEIEKIVDNCAKKGITAIFLQVRPYADALYKSDIFPSSAVIVKKQGDKLPTDVLQCFIDKAHKKGIALHAWINPFRITSITHDTSQLSPSSPAVLHPEWVVKNYGAENKEAGLWFNPGLPEVRALVAQGVAELVEGYNIDGIHLDDYFYPYDSAVFDDSAAYSRYSGEKSLADFRRWSVTELVKKISAITENTEFGISPCGVWAQKSAATPDGTPGLGATIQAYSDVYADTKKWVEDGLVDYICPQLYWETSNNAAPFDTLADWWCELCEKNNIRLYIGLASYKSDLPAWAGEISRQTKYLEYKTVCDGVIYFSYRSIKDG